MRTAAKWILVIAAGLASILLAQLVIRKLYQIGIDKKYVTVEYFTYGEQDE